MYSQVVIKDSVKITPKQPIKNSNQIQPNSLREPWEADLPVTLPVLSGATVKVFFLQSLTNATITSVVMRSPISQLIFPSDSFKDGSLWTSQKFPQATNVEIGINWEFENSVGIESGAIVDVYNQKKYRIWFEDIGVRNTSTEMYLDWNDMVVDVIFQYELHHFDVFAGPTEIEYGGTAIIGARAIDEHGNELVLDDEIPWDAPVAITANPEGYGHFEFGGGASRTLSGGVKKRGNEEIVALQNHGGKNLPSLKNGVKMNDEDVPMRRTSETKKVMNKKTSSLKAAGNTVSLPFECTYWDIISGVQYVADGPVPDSVIKINFTVTSMEHPSATGEASILLLPKGCPVVVFSDSTITPGDTIDVTIKRKINDSTFVDYPAGQLFHIGITQGAMYGNLLINGERKSSEEPVTMPVKFIADTSFDVDSTILTIQGYPVEVVASARSTKKKSNVMKELSGEKCSDFTDLKIGKYSIELIPNVSPEIWPVFLGKNDGSASLDRYGYNPTLKNIKIRVKDIFGKPVINKEIILKTEFVEQSGEHKHEVDGSQTILPQSKQGSFYWSNGQGYKLSGNELRGIFTDNKGEIAVDSFTGTYYSGEYIIKAMAASIQSVFDTTKLFVKVPSLIDFKTLPKPYWTFSQTISGTANHPNNNWCTFELASGLPFLLQDFYEMMKEEGSEFVFSLNDMSLPCGGSFDIDGRWNEILPDTAQSHNLHRVGLSVDFNSEGLKDVGKHYVAAFYRMREFVKKYKCRNINEGIDGPIHFEFDFNNSYSQ